MAADLFNPSEEHAALRTLVREFTEREVDPQALYDYVHFHMVPAPYTIHAGRHRLLPGSVLTWRDGRLEVRAYWEMRYVESRKRPMQQLKGEFLDALRSGVKDAASGGAVGAFLSGGTDSSTIAGLLGEVSGKPARTYSIGFEAQGYDEMAYARIAARHFGTQHHEYYVTAADVVKGIAAGCVEAGAGTPRSHCGPAPKNEPRSHPASKVSTSSRWIGRRGTSSERCVIVSATPSRRSSRCRAHSSSSNLGPNRSDSSAAGETCSASSPSNVASSPTWPGRTSPDPPGCTSTAGVGRGRLSEFRSGLRETRRTFERQALRWLLPQRLRREGLARSPGHLRTGLA